MRIGRSGSALGTSVSTAELEAPNRATDHFSTGPTDVSGSRTNNTQYTNAATARVVAARLTSSVASPTLQVQLSSAGAPTTRWSHIGGGSFDATAVFIVPPGWNYRLVLSNFVSVVEWQEMNL